MLTLGTRWRLRHDVDRYPDFVAPCGSVGKVVYAGSDCIILDMEQHIKGCEPWDNTICWHEAHYFGEEYDYDFRDEFIADCEPI